MNKIIKGDTLNVLKQLESSSVDLSITSPPYNKKLIGGKIVKKVEYDVYIDNIDENLYQENQIEIINELYRVLKPGGSLFYNHKCRYEKKQIIHPITWLSKTNFQLRQEIIWNRKSTGNLSGYRFWNIDERIYWLYKPGDTNLELKSKHAKMTSIWEIIPERNNNHPAPFPVDIPLRIIYSILDDDTNDKIVLDPYMGSGTTGVACKLLGCNYLGIDISDQYISMANNRIENFELYRTKCNDEISKHIIKGKTYKERKNK